MSQANMLERKNAVKKQEIKNVRNKKRKNNDGKK